MHAKVLDAIIGAIMKRTTLHTLSIKRDFIGLPNTLEKPLAVICLDFLKAFDREDWNFIFSKISFFFAILVRGTNLFTWFKLLPPISNLKLKEIVSRLTSDSFTLIQRFCQVCPLSPLAHFGRFAHRVAHYYCG